MFDGDFEELFDIIKHFFLYLGHISLMLLKTVIFWVFALLPGFIGASVFWMTGNIWVLMVTIITLGLWAFLLIISEQNRY